MENLFNLDALNAVPRAVGFEKQLPNLAMYQLNWGPFAKLTDGFDPDEIPGFTKASKNVSKAEGFWRGLYESLVGKAEGELARAGAYKCGLANLIPDDINSVMQFVPASMEKPQMDKLAAIASGILTDWSVHVVSGNHTTNAKAQQQVKDWTYQAELEGKKGVWLISAQMATRSFSVAHINVVLLTYDAGGLGATIQKISRALTPGGGKTTGHIVSLSLLEGRDDKTDAIVLEAATKVAETQEVDIETAIRRVHSTMPIFTIEDGDLITLSESEYLNQVMTLRQAERISVNLEGLITNYDLVSHIVRNLGKGGNRLASPDAVLLPGVTYKDPRAQRDTEGRSDNDFQRELNDARERLEKLAESAPYFSLFADCTASIDTLLSNLRDTETAEEFYEEFNVTPQELETLLEVKALNRVGVESAMSIWLAKA
jgi:hypothetical protein